MNNKHKIVCFGELLARLAAPGHNRLAQCESLEIRFTGAEANVAVSLRNFGLPASVVSAVPNHAIGSACIAFLQRYGVDTTHIVQHGSRLGLFYLETGACQRPSQVIYDRANSAFAELTPGTIPWSEVFHNSQWFHISGTAPAVSESAAETALEACRIAKDLGITTSIDMNYRGKLWRWKPGIKPRDLAEATMRLILPYIDVIIGNEEDAACVLNIHAANTDVQQGRLDINGYPAVARAVAKQFDNAKYVAITLRESISASHNRWGGMLYNVATDSACFAPCSNNRYMPYEITHIVDRVGAGDSFSAGLIYGLLELKSDQDSVAFAAAASCLKHTIPGDFNLVSVSEVNALAGGNSAGRVQR